MIFGIIGGEPLSFWAGFHLLVVALLLADLLLLGRRNGGIPAKTAWLWTAMLAALAAVFGIWLGMREGRQTGLEFASGYLIETSLSIDNLFVFLLMFRSFRLNTRQQHKALLWGVLGAILMRALFIAAGVALLDRFAWLEYVFGAFLLYAAIRLALQKEEQEAEEPTRWSRWIGKSASPDGKMLLKKFLLVIVAVELTDLIFALDSIPAVLAITRKPFVVYTSNIFAILGLRSLYFALSSFLNRFYLLHYGLAAILAFVGLKMLTDPWVDISIVLSLTVILGILAICIGLSLAFPKKTVPHARPS